MAWQEILAPARAARLAEGGTGRARRRVARIATTALAMVVVWSVWILGAETAAQQNQQRPNQQGPRAEITVADYAYIRGVELLRGGDVGGALGLLRLAARQRPDQAAYREALGDAYLALGRDQAAVLALAEYEAALEAEPGRRNAQEGLIQAAMVTGRIELALATLEAMLLGDGEPEVRFVPDLTALYLMLDQAARGIALFERIEGAVPEQARSIVRISLASLYRYQGRYDLALGAAAAVSGDPSAPADLRALAQRLAVEWEGEWRSAQ